MNNEELKALIDDFRKLPDETEWVEFKSFFGTSYRMFLMSSRRRIKSGIFLQRLATKDKIIKNVGPKKKSKWVLRQDKVTIS